MQAYLDSFRIKSVIKNLFRLSEQRRRAGRTTALFRRWRRQEFAASAWQRGPGSLGVSRWISSSKRSAAALISSFPRKLLVAGCSASVFFLDGQMILEFKQQASSLQDPHTLVFPSADQRNEPISVRLDGGKIHLKVPISARLKANLSTIGHSQGAASLFPRSGIGIVFASSLFSIKCKANPM